MKPTTSHVNLLTWVEKERLRCSPDKVYWCNGSDEEGEFLCSTLLESGTFIKLKREGCYLARTDPRDVNFIDSRTFVCSNSQVDAGATNLWMQPSEMKVNLGKLFAGCMVGRTMYVIPCCMGPLGSTWSKFTVVVTDSPYVAVVLSKTYRVGTQVLAAMNDNAPFLPALHSVGMPLYYGQRDHPWPCSPDNVWVALFPDDPTPNIMAFGSTFSFLSSRNFTLRLASAETKRTPTFLASHSSIISLTSPAGQKKYFCLTLPSGTGQTGAPFEISTLPGWTQQCVSADTAWINVGKDGRLVAVNPHAGFHGVATGTSDYTNRGVMDTIEKNTIFTNCALTMEGDVWWEGMTSEPPAQLIDWTGQKWTPGCGRVAAHPASSYVVSSSQCPTIDPNWENPNGVPISAIIFGTRLSAGYPLVFEAFNWKQGIFWGSNLRVESRFAFGEQIPEHRDPLAMGSYCGVNISEYISNWMNIRKYLGYSSPKIFVVNWFRAEGGKKLWPGFSENCRVLEWVFGRVDGSIPDAKRAPIGYVPTIRSFDMSGLQLGIDVIGKLFSIEREHIINDLPNMLGYLEKLGTGKAGNGSLAVLRDTLNQLSETICLGEDQPPTTNRKLVEWVDAARKLCKPDKVHWCTGTDVEYDEMCSLLVQRGTFIPLNPRLRPNSYLARSDPRDVARVESKTWICSSTKDDAGPTNNWKDPKEMKQMLDQLFEGCMKGRTMYVIPFCMGPLGSPYSRYGVEISDSPYVVVNMKIMTRIGTPVLTYMGNLSFLPCLHSVGCPLLPGQQDVSWPCNPESTVIAHFPEDPSVMSFGSGYGGNALLGKKCFSLRIASVLGRKEGWLAEHMLILGLTSPQGVKTYVVAAFPSACGKTNLAMLVPTLPGWIVRCIGDDIAWLHVAADGTLRAINPENGFFGVAPGTSEKSNPSAMRTMNKNSIFTNVALTPDEDVWWEGMTDEPPENLVDWKGEQWTPGCGRLAAHPNSRYTVPASQCPVIDPDWENPGGVPVSAIMFGGRRNSLMPLVLEAFSWQHGVFLGSIVSSEMTAAAEGQIGAVRRDPFGMLPFCGYNMADYWNHWMEFRNFLGYNSPKIFYVNWFKKQKLSDGSIGKYLWPGFGENSRVLKWICRRIGRNPTARTVRTPLGYVPAPNDLDVSSLDLNEDVLTELNAIDFAEWEREVPMIQEFYKKFGNKVPSSLYSQLEDLKKRLSDGPDTTPPTNNKKIIAWVEQVRTLVKPSRVHWCTGSSEENKDLCALLVKQGTFIPLNQKLKENCFLARSDPRDVARVESKTFICTPEKEDTGPTNNWADPEEMKKKLDKLFDGCMRGRTMYVIPFCMGPLGSPYSKLGIEISDSPYVVVNMRIMTRMGLKALNMMSSESKFFLPCLHSVGQPLSPGQEDVSWPCNPENTVIAHFPEDPSVMSFGSGYGGNALLGKKCYSLRIASYLGRKEGWLAEHMLLLGLTSPEGKKYYIAAAFPSACGKTNLAMLVPTLPGWIVRCVGDDIGWFHVGEDGRLYAINPENGFFGVAPGTSALTNSSAMETINRNTIFTNVALTPEGDVWWEGMTKQPPASLIDWTGKPWTPDCGRPAAHPNSRYTAPADQSPVIDPEWETASGVPVCAVLFGGRRERVVPLVMEAFIWEHGVLMGSIVASEQTAAAEGKIGNVRRDPFAMLPFCGYNMGDYWKHWLDFRKKMGYLSPKVFYVNWFRKENGKFLWPGFGENCRVLKWICERVDGTGKARATPIGYVPTHDALDLGGLNIGQDTLHKLLHVDCEQWLEEIPSIREYYATFGSRLPNKLRECLDGIEAKLLAATAVPTGNPKLVKWIEEMTALLEPSSVHWCTGTEEETDQFCDQMVAAGTAIRLAPSLRPNSFLVRTHPNDTRRDVANTFVCTDTPEEAGPLNNWAPPKETREAFTKLFSGAMKGRTMYVLVYSIGPLSSPFSRFGVQVTDSLYVAVSTTIQARVGAQVLHVLPKETEDFFTCVHSVGRPLVVGAGEKDEKEKEEGDEAWPCNLAKKKIAFFVDSKKNNYQMMSYGSAWGSNAVACRIPHSVSLASLVSRSQNWFAECCAILSITSPEGKKIYVAAWLPKGCGKTALSMNIPTIPGWTVRCVGEDIAWFHIGDNGTLWANNPVRGFYDVASGTSDQSNRAGMVAFNRNTIFTNCALTSDGDVWWEGKTKTPPDGLKDWQGNPWNPNTKNDNNDKSEEEAGEHEDRNRYIPAAHPNSRYTCPSSQCPLMEPENPYGVPISAFIFGGKRKEVLPLVTEAAVWEQGMFLASIIGKDTETGVERTPFGVTPYLGYNINHYMKKWIDFRTTSGYNIPKIFVVNWFRSKPGSDVPLWPGFRENARILKWIHQRTTGTGSGGGGRNTPLGFVPDAQDLDLRGCYVRVEEVAQSLAVKKVEWKKECAEVEEFYKLLGDELPEELAAELQRVKEEFEFY